jgi:tyrosinase
MAAMRVRQDAWKLPKWDPIILWYAKAIREMKDNRKIQQPISWRYQAAIHDYIPGADPLADPGDVLPPKSEQKRFWRQCQHSSWFFLPWHRMYLYYFERIVAATIVQLNGPAGWSLPYWNYSDTSNPDAQRLPPAFIEPKMPDGSLNPLLVLVRQEGNDGGLVGDPTDVDITQCLGETVFAADPIGGDPGFGGPKTLFNHSQGSVGTLEQTPHGNMHVAVGGWMGQFNTAGLDPIFWLHHSNIDRLWNVWLKRAAQDTNPTDAQWLTGVTFEFHDEAGNIAALTPDQVVDSTAAPLSYSYQDESDPLVAGPAPAAVTTFAMEPRPMSEMVGAVAQPVTLTGQLAHAHIPIKPATGPARESLTVSAAPQRAFLNIESITGSGRPERYSVYLNVPEGDDPAQHPELHAGDLPMFGVVESSQADEGHPGGGLHYTLDITKVVRALESQNAWNPNDLHVTFVPKQRRAGVAPAGVQPAPHQISVGRLSLYFA